MSNSKPSLPRGTRDFGPKTTAKRSYIINIIKGNFLKYGFSQIETPAIENLSVLTGKYGNEGDQLLYKILNSGDYLSKTSPEDFAKGSGHLTTKIVDRGLRYDLTVPFARFVAMSQNKISFPFKRFQVQPVWRADRPQKGRYREFYQCDADIIGSKGLWNEIELTLLFKDIFTDLKLQNYVIKINHRAFLFALAEYVQVKEQAIAFCTELDKLDKIGEEQVINNIIGLGAERQKLGKVMELLKTKDKDQILNDLLEVKADTAIIEELRNYFKAIASLGKNLKVELDLSLARGLSYYTGMIFEVKPTSVQVGSICGGGRYDDLAGVFGLKGISGVGISFGLDRIYDVMEALSLFPQKISNHLDVLILHFNEDNLKHAYPLVVKLRDAGIRSDLYPVQAKIKKQFDYADKINALFTLIVGDNEMETQQYMLKDMRTGNQEPLALDEIIARLKG